MKLPAFFLIGLSLLAPLSASAFLGMNAGANLQGPLPAWTKQLGVASSGEVTARAAASDTSGNLYIAGQTDSGVDGNTLTGTYDFFVTKYDSSGAKQWTRQMGAASQNTNAFGVATDSSGNIFVTGYTQGGLDGNTRTGMQDLFLVKYNSSGTKQWTKQLGVTSRQVYANGLAIDSSGNIYVSGYTDGNLDGNTITGDDDIFLVKYDTAGTKQWTKLLGTSSTMAMADSIAIDASGNIFVTGQTNGGLDGNTLTGSWDFFLTKFDSSGTKQWTQQMGVASAYTAGKGVTTDSSGNILVVGQTGGGLDGNTLTGTSDFFLTKYNSSGTKQWTQQMGVASVGTFGYGVVTDASGNIFVTGRTNGGLDGNTLKGATDFFITKFTTAGTKQWTKQMGGTGGSTIAYAITLDSSGRLYVTGSTTRAIDFSTQSGSNDAFACQYIGN